MSKIFINEEMRPEKEWFEQAKKQTLDTLPEFIRHVMNDYAHDYGTVCHAISACALAAAWTANNEPEGGITGFQAGFVMWDFVLQWSYTDNKCGMRIVDYDKLLYPQYGDYYEKTISPATWAAVQEQAKKNLETERGYAVHQGVAKHWQSIVDGNVPHGFTVKTD